MSNFKIPPDEALARVEALFNQSRDIAEVALKIAKEKTPFDRATLIEALNIVKARFKARERRFPEWAMQGFFVPEVLEQATHPLVASHHASRFGRCEALVEIGTGIASDCAAFSKVATRVISIDNDERCASYAHVNLNLQSISNVEVICSAAEDYFKDDQTLKFDALWADPSRREGGLRKSRDIDQYSPSLSWILGLSVAPKVGIKISPVVEVGDATGCSKEWIGFQGECKEQILWRGLSIAKNSVTIVETNEQFSPNDEAEGATNLDFAPVWADQSQSTPKFIISPHPALFASGLVQSFFIEKFIENLDGSTTHGYGVTQSAPSASGFYSAYQVLEHGSFGIPSIQEGIVRYGFGPGTQIHKRGDTVLPEDLREKLRFNSNGIVGDILLAKIGKKRVYFLAKRLSYDR